MLKTSLTEAKLQQLQRVEDYVAAHPACTAGDIGLALGIKRTTLNGYTRELRQMGRLRGTAHGHAGVHGTLPDTFQMAPNLGPLADATPIPSTRRARRSAIQVREPAQRMDIVEAFFGPALRVIS